MQRLKLIFVCACAVWLSIGTGRVLAATISWAAGNSGDFGTAANWTGGVVPGGADTAVFNVAGTYVVSFATTRDTSALTVGLGTVIFGLNGQTYLLGNNINIGSTAGQSATLQLLNGNLEPTNTLDVGAGGAGTT